MSKLTAAQILLQFNTRKESTELARKIGVLLDGSFEGIRIPEEPDRYYRDYASGFFPDQSVTSLKAGDYIASRDRVDGLYVQYAQAMNAQIDKVLPTRDVGKLCSQLSKIWGSEVGLRVFGSRLDFRQGKMNIHVSRTGNEDVRITGFSAEYP